MGTVAGVMAIVFVPFFAVGIAITIITFLKRRRAGAGATASKSTGNKGSLEGT